MSSRLVTCCCLVSWASAAARADEVRWRHVATRGVGSGAHAHLRTFCKPAASSTPVLQASDGEPPRKETPTDAIASNRTAVIRNDAPANSRANRDSVERDIGVECSRFTREYTVNGDADGRIVVGVALRSDAEWNRLIARVRTMRDLGAQAVIVRGSVP